MTTHLQSYTLPKYVTQSGVSYKNLTITYEVFGKALHTAPIVLVHHALTGNSDVVSKEKGWWKDLVGNGKLIDTQHYTVIAFNTPGNGYNGDIITSYQDFCLRDVAKLYLMVLKALGVNEVYASIGGSIGGSVAWELGVLAPNLMSYIIPIASDWKATDWVLGYCCAQAEILEHSKRPLSDARIMAMLFYRTPHSLTEKFNRTKTADGQFNTASWLQYHGKRLESRFELVPYKLMNHLLATVDITKGDTFESVVKNISATIVQVAIDTDYFFVKDENIKTHKMLQTLGIKSQYHEVKSIHGHDGFLIEFEQIAEKLKPIFE